MTRLHLVRHAEAAGGWAEDADPGLSDIGLAQAAAMAERLADLGPLPVLTSPMRRARETAAAIERRWSTMATVETGVGEIPSPTEDLAERHAWLQTALASTWPSLGPRYTSWRTMVTSLLVGVGNDTIVVTHFVLINAVIGLARDDDRVVIEPVPPAGVVVVDVDHGRFAVVSLPSGGAAGPVL